MGGRIVRGAWWLKSPEASKTTLRRTARRMSCSSGEACHTPNWLPSRAATSKAAKHAISRQRAATMPAAQCSW